MNILLNKFDLSSIRKACHIQIHGKRRVGKTTLIKDLIKTKFQTEAKLLFNPIEEKEYSDDLVRPELTYRNYDSQVVDYLVQIQKKRVEKLGWDKIRENGVVVISDDGIHDWKKIINQNLNFIFMNGRHYAINTILTQQYPITFSPNLRVNLDYIFIFHEPNIQSRRHLYNHYAGMFPTFDDFCATLDQVTKDYGCLVIDNNTRSYQLEDRIFWYQARDPKIEAVTKIANWWLRIQAQRHLSRLKIGREIKLVPGIGVKYHEALERFKLMQNNYSR